MLCAVDGQLYKQILNYNTQSPAPDFGHDPTVSSVMQMILAILVFLAKVEAP
jgi:hypothetical protein